MQQAYTLHVDAPAEREDGTIFRDGDVRQRLVEQGLRERRRRIVREWMRCSPDDVKTAVTELQTGLRLTGTHHETFQMRREQAEAVNKTHAYFHSIWKEDMHAVPRFLWNAKMRFGKTFAAYQLAKKLGAIRVLVVTFKPAVEDAWQTDLESHVDFDGWQYLSRSSGSDSDADRSRRSRSSTSARSRTCSAGRQPATSRPRTSGSTSSTGTSSSSTSTTSARGATPRRSCSRARTTRSPRRRPSSSTPPAWRASTKTSSELSEQETEFLPITTRAYLYLSGTPFRALATGEFIEEQIFNWTYTDEQRAKEEFAASIPSKWNPYGALPQMRLLTYQMPDELLAIASQGEFDEFDLNEFFAATGTGASAEFKHKNDVQKWLDIIRGSYAPTQVDNLKLGTPAPAVPVLRRAAAALPAALVLVPARVSPPVTRWRTCSPRSTTPSGTTTRCSPSPALRPGSVSMRCRRCAQAIGSGFETKTITLSCGKLTTGVTVPQWSSILMLRNLKSPETYFQAAFRVQSPWSIKNPNGDDPNEEEILKPVCFVFDFAPTRALRQLADYGVGLSPDEPQPREGRRGARVVPACARLRRLPHDAGRRRRHPRHRHGWHVSDAAWLASGSRALLVNVDNDTLRRILDSPEAMEAVDAHRGLPRARRQHHRDRHQQEREGQRAQEEGQGR